MKRGFCFSAVGLVVLAGCAVFRGSGNFRYWERPAGEAVSVRESLTVNRRPVALLACRVSAVPFNQVWPGYQRPLDQTELATFASWDMSGPVQIEIRSKSPVRSVVVRPASLDIKPAIDGDRIRFTLMLPGPVIVEINGCHHALHLFANPLEAVAPLPDTPGLRYFGPGIHRPGKIELKSNERVYIDGGAVVYGSIQASNATNITIRGRGVLDVSQAERGKGGGAIRLSGCSDVTVEGLVLRDPDVWCFSLFGCARVTIENVKLVGLWRYNADGIDVCNSQDVIVRDCFVRAYDDALVVKGLKSAYDNLPVRNIRFSRCVLWCDWGRAMEIGAETCAPEIADVSFEDCDIVRTTHIAMDIQHGDRGAVRDIRFQKIRIEIDPTNPIPRMQKAPGETYSGHDGEGHLPSLMTMVIFKTFYSKDRERGAIRNVLFKDIDVLSAQMPPSSFRGFDDKHGIDSVTLENVRFNGKPVRGAEAARLHIGQYVTNVRFAETSKK